MTVRPLVFLLAVLWFVTNDSRFEPLTVILSAFGTLLVLTARRVPERIRPIGNSKRANDRERMIRRVQQSWIEGFLYPAMREVKALKIGLTLKPDAVFRHKDLGECDLKDSGDIFRVFGWLEGRMLILGAPGAGKTILLLQLVEMLLQEAKNYPAKNLPVPVVFNMASWAREQKSLYDWLVDECWTLYRVKPKVAKRWLDNNGVIVMLDGLDEVKEEVRPKCVDAINAFRELRPSLRMVVCSRIQDYEILPEKLNLKGALLVDALTQEQVASYLQNDPALEGLRTVLAEDETLREMSTTPFLLNTMVYTYGGQEAVALRGYPTPAERRRHLFERYIEKRLQENPSPWGYTDTLRYLKWLATKMQAYTQTVFRPEDIQPYWLDLNYQYLFQRISLAFLTLVRGLQFAALGVLISVALSLLFPHRNNLRWVLIFGILGFIEGSILFLIPFIWKKLRPKKQVRYFPLLKFNEERGQTGLILRFALKMLLLKQKVVPMHLGEFLQGMVDRHIMRSINGGYVFVHRSLIESMASMDELPFILVLQHFGDNEAQRHASEAVERIGLPAIVFLIRMMIGSEDSSVRTTVVKALGEEKLVTIFSSFLHEEDKALQSKSAEILQIIGTPEALEAVKQWRESQSSQNGESNQ